MTLLRFDKEKVLTFFDAETFNLCLNFCQNRPWQVAMIQMKGDKILSEHDIRIKWETDLQIGEQAAVITRYSQEDQDRLQIPAKEAFKTVFSVLEKTDYIVGHNIFGFDIYILQEMYKFFGKDPSNLIFKMLDTNLIAKGIKMAIPFDKSITITEYQYKIFHEKKKGIKTGLSTLGKEFGIEFDENKLHDALNDLRLNIEVWNKLKFNIDI